ncbi:4Fe-4S ferredoxin iron-sulfur binding domain-containing protein [Desulfotomaculum nigrificans CO-1-SRB]|uniref:4Fe-4S ferredoxin iron-sulfur binding domain-containing protein n=1 Tax=Desulfotomaculum nigrificans (strain DSM 14880 / VKM B-2319 / CO-1-SRB) TaxID=868595 RepID=F6B3X6_DESCC|nr:ferredoxin family protein [Desulfotomaculum nigrificans]AEF92941.1 4Fe-4S ferredoxin iron-sulfur binding domain-containing protein [Desulfotomaculum nigrificans CO-1-SRB]
MEFKGRTLELTKCDWTLFTGLCKGCGLCIQKCPKKCIAWSKVLGVYGTPSVEANDECIACGICQMVCPDTAIRVDKRAKEA